jgi:PAS domain-containing protein
MKEKAREEALRGSEARFRSYFNLSGQNRHTSPETGWIDANDTLCRMLGYGQGRSDPHDLDVSDHPADLDIDLAQLKRCFRRD